MDTREINREIYMKIHDKCMEVYIEGNIIGNNKNMNRVTTYQIRKHYT